MNLDLLDQTVRVLGKGQKERIVQVGRPALEAIHAYRIQAHVREGPLFLDKRRTRISGHSVERMLQKYLSATSIKLQVSPHTLRHCFATHLLDNGAVFGQRAEHARPREAFDYGNLHPR